MRRAIICRIDSVEDNAGGSKGAALLWWVLAVAVCWSTVSGAHAATYVLRGTVVAPDQVFPRGKVVVTGDRIFGVGDAVAIPPGAIEITIDGMIYPGLIDLHNHVTWNVFPRWRPRLPQTDRYEWQELSEYHDRLAGPETALIDKGLGCDLERYGEIKALIGGATAITGSFAPTDKEPERNACDQGLVRNLDFASGLPGTAVNRELLRYDTFPFELSPDKTKLIRENLGKSTLQAEIIHLAEGSDASAHREFRMLTKQELLLPGVTLIHGVALAAEDFRTMHDHHVGLVWSPRSNLELYGKTADVRAAKTEGVTMALAPDWSPTGSSSMLDELAYASWWNDHQGTPVFSARELFLMATINPAHLAGVQSQLGQLTSGYQADLLVLRAHDHGDPYRALLTAQAGDVLLVTVAGRALYGDPDLMRRLAQSPSLEQLTVCGVPKLLDLTDDDAGKGISLRVTTDILSSALAAHGITLAPLAECP
jgi:5-methylthioadenosine/S-adenosylhomocysteine deaminase